MKYFILRQHPYFLEKIQLNDWQEKIKAEWVCFQDFHKVPRRCVLTATLGENIPFPDIVTSPFLLLGGLIVDMAKLYGESFYARDMVVINEEEQQCKHYYLTLLETVEQGHILWGEGNLFNLNVNGRREIVVSQDFAESILRRGVMGIMLEKIDI